MTTILICDITNLNYKKYLHVISKYHYEKVHRFKNEIDKKLMVASELLLKKYLTEKNIDIDVLDITLDRKKPFIKNSIYKFSFSHSKRYSCCAISQNNIGLDIEVPRIISPSFKKRYNLDNFTNDQVLVKWTQYESYYKLRNKNLSFNNFLNNYNSFIKTYVFDQYFLSVALEKEEEIEIIEIDCSKL